MGSLLVVNLKHKSGHLNCRKRKSEGENSYGKQPRALKHRRLGGGGWCWGGPSVSRPAAGHGALRCGPRASDPALPFRKEKLTCQGYATTSQPLLCSEAPLSNDPAPILQSLSMQHMAAEGKSHIVNVGTSPRLRGNDAAGFPHAKTKHDLCVTALRARTGSREASSESHTDVTCSDSVDPSQSHVRHGSCAKGEAAPPPPPQEGVNSNGGSS